MAEILQGRLRAGERLIIRELADRLGVSPTPVREALVALEGIGLVDAVPNRGAVVRNMTAEDVREISQVRRALECEAVRLACGRVELAELHELAKAFREMRSAKRPTKRFIDKARELDDRLHDLIANSCGNRFLLKEIGRLKLLFRAFRDVSWEYEQANQDFLRCVEEAGEHLVIVEALLAGDAKAASRSMARHIRSGVKYWSRALPAA